MCHTHIYALRKSLFNKGIHLHWIGCHCHCYGLNVICAGFQCESLQEKAAFQSECIQDDKRDAHTKTQKRRNTCNNQCKAIYFDVLHKCSSTKESTMTQLHHKEFQCLRRMLYAVKLWCLLFTSVWLLINQETKDQIVFISQLVTGKVAQVHRKEDFIKKNPTLGFFFCRVDFPKSIQ